MPRKPRHHRPDAILHATARGVDRQPIFLSDGDREFFLASIDEALAHTRTAKLGFTLMPNHFHYELGTSDAPISLALHDALTRYAVRFNRLHGRSGHLFEGRFWSAECTTLSRVENTIAYINLNPVRAKIVSRPEDWRWSSHRAWVEGRGSGIDFGRLEELTGQSFEDVQERYLRKVAREVAPEPTGSPPDELIADTASLFGMTPAELSSGRKGEIYTHAKLRLLRRWEREGHELPHLARLLDCTPQALYNLKKRRMRQE